MKLIKSKRIQKAEGRKKGKYKITLEVTDYDIEMLELLDHTYAPFEKIEEPSEKNDWVGKYSPEFTDKYQSWINKTWRIFCSMWIKYDEDTSKGSKTS